MANNSRLAELIKRAKRLGIHRTPKFQEMLRIAVSQSPLTAGLDMLEEFIAIFEAKVSALHFPISLTPPSTNIAGPIELATTLPHLKRVGITTAELTRMLLVLGRIGSGKSSFAGRLIRQMPRNRGVLIFDRFGEFQYLTATRDDIIYLPYTHFSHSFFRAPPGCNQKTYINRSCETLAVEEGLFVGAETVLAREVTNDWQQGLQAHGPAYVPTIGHIVERLRRIHVEYFERQYVVRARIRLEKFLMGLESTFNTVTSCLPYLLDKLVIINMQGMETNNIFPFISQILLWLETYFEHLGPPEYPLRYVVIIDEAHHLFSAAHARLTAGEPSFISRVLDSRGRGVGLVLMSQEGQALHSVARSQPATRMYFALGSAEDAHEAATYLWGNDADADQERSLFNLPQGCCWIRHPRSPDAHLAAVPFLNPRHCPYDPELVFNRSVKRLLEAGFHPQPGHTPATPISSGEASQRIPTDTSNPPPPKDQSKRSSEHLPVSGESEKFIKQIALAPFSTVKEIRKHLNLSGSLYDRIHKELAGHPDLVVFVQLATGQHGRAPQWAQLMPAGFAYAGIKAPPELDHKTTQALHNFWKERGCRTLKATGKYAHIYIDRKIGNKKKIDLAAFTPSGELHAYEIELQPDLRHLLQNIELDLEVGAVKVIILVPDKEMAAKAKELIAGKAPPFDAQHCEINVESLGGFLEAE